VNTRGQTVSRLLQRIKDLYASAAPADLSSISTRSRLEFQALAFENLGGAYPTDKIARVADIQNQFREKQLALIAKLEAGTLSSDAYTELFRSLLAETASRSEAVLGSHDFKRLFGVPAEAAADIIQKPLPH
jgi:hypothetical protein